MSELMTMNQEQKMSSREIAELTGKEHHNVLRDCDNLNDNYLKMNEDSKMSYRMKPIKYDYEQLSMPVGDGKKKIRVAYLTKLQTFDLMTGYNTQLRIKVNRRWAELEAEKQQEIPQTYSQALMLAAKQAEELEKQNEQIKELEPKADFYDIVTDSKTAIDIGRAAKVLDMGIGRNKLFQKLRNKKVLMNNNTPYQEYIDRGYFRIIESKYQKPDGSTHIQMKTLVYQKGLDYIRKILS